MTCLSHDERVRLEFLLTESATSRDHVATMLHATEAERVLFQRDASLLRRLRETLFKEARA